MRPFQGLYCKAKAQILLDTYEFTGHLAANNNPTVRSTAWHGRFSAGAGSKPAGRAKLRPLDWTWHASQFPCVRWEAPRNWAAAPTRLARGSTVLRVSRDQYSTVPILLVSRGELT